MVRSNQEFINYINSLSDDELLAELLDAGFEIEDDDCEVYEVKGYSYKMSGNYDMDNNRENNSTDPKAQRFTLAKVPLAC